MVVYSEAEELVLLVCLFDRHRSSECMGQGPSPC